jgi:hypothetical protein
VMQHVGRLQLNALDGGHGERRLYES